MMMKYQYRWEFITGIVFLVLWIGLALFSVYSLFLNLQVGSLFAILNGLLIVWSVWNANRFRKEIQDYLARKKVGDVAS